MSIKEPNIKEFGLPIYLVTPENETNLRISAILNEALHVYDWHKEGLWVSVYKDAFASLLANEISNHPKTIRNIINLNNRVFSMVTYRAAELLSKN